MDTYFSSLIHENPISKNYMKQYENSPLLPISMKPAIYLRGHHGCINTCSFNPYGEYELTGSDDGCVWMWDIGERCTTPKVLLRPHHTNLFTTNFLSKDRFISGANDASVQYVQIGESEVIATGFDNHHVKKVNSSFVIDENTFATCSHDCTIRLFDVRQQYSHSSTRKLPYLSLERDFNYDSYPFLLQELEQYQIESQGAGGGPKVPPDPSDIATDSILIDLRSESNSQIFVMDVHPFNKKLFVAGIGDGSARLYDLRNLKGPVIGYDISSQYHKRLSVTGCSFDDSGERLALSAWGGDVHVVATNSAAVIPPLAFPEPNNHGGQPLYSLSSGISLQILNNLQDQMRNPNPNQQNNNNQNRDQRNNNNNNQENDENDQNQEENEDENEQQNDRQNQEEAENRNENDNNDNNDNTDNTDNNDDQDDPIRVSLFDIFDPNTRRINPAFLYRYFEESRHPRGRSLSRNITVCKGHKNSQNIRAVNWLGNYIVTGSDDGWVFFYDSEDGKIINTVKAHDHNVNVLTVHREKKLLATSGVDYYSVLWEPSNILEVDEDERLERENRIKNATERNMADIQQEFSCNVM